MQAMTRVFLHNRAKPMTETFKKQLEAVIAEYESALWCFRH